MGNTFLDLRYEVIDPDKAASLVTGNVCAYIQDVGTGTRFFIPAPPGEGAFPPSVNRFTSATKSLLR